MGKPQFRFRKFFACDLLTSQGVSGRNFVRGGICTLRQSQKTKGFCVADFATLSDEGRSRSKIFPLFIWIKGPCVRKFEGLECSKHLGISQTNLYAYLSFSKYGGEHHVHELQTGSVRGYIKFMQ